MTGENIGKLREAITPPEWFDLDRSEKTMENQYRRRYSDIKLQAELEHWKEQPHKCPKCQNGALSYGNEDENGDRRDGYTFIACSWCDSAGWVEDEEV